MAKYRAYAEYKDSGLEWLGEIPSHWKIASLRFLVEAVSNGSTASQVEESETTVPISRIESISTGEIDLNKVGFVDMKTISQNFKLHKNDILLSHINSLPMVGNIALKRDDSTLFHGMNLLRLVPNRTITAPYYLFWLLKSIYFRKSVESVAKPAINQASVSIDSLKNIKLLVPNIDEQLAIANFLDHETTKIDHLIEKQQQLIELLKEKRQAVISHAVTKGLDPNVPMKDSGVEWLGEVPEHWTKSKLVSVADGTKGCFVNGPFGSDLLANELRDEGVPVVYIRDIKPTGYKRKSTVHVTEQKARQLEICNVKVDDVIISKVGDPPGDACLYPKGEPDAIVTQDVIRIRVDRSKFNPKFIVYLLNSDFGRLVMDNISVEGTRKRVSLGDFKDTRFVFPPLEEQELIVENLNSACKSIDLIIARAIHGIGLIQERRTALISAAVTGKIDVRNWQAPTLAEADTELSA